MSRHTMKTLGRPWAYGCSPFAAPSPERMAQHVRWAQALSRQIWADGFWPILPHLYTPQFLDDTDPADRAVGLRWGLDLLERCVLMYVCDVPPSTGMQGELARAQAFDLPMQLWVPDDVMDDAQLVHEWEVLMSNER